MNEFIVKGLSGKKILDGVLPVRGAKNAALKALAASILFKDEVLLHNVPFIEDVIKMRELLEELGVEVKKISKRSFQLRPDVILKTNLNEEIAKSFRSSIVLTGPLLAREGRVSFPHPGGCVIGKRPIDVFLEAFQRMGARLKTDKTMYILEAKKLRGIDMFLKVPSVTVTEPIIMTAVLIKGITRLCNCACEPEITALVEFLNSGGANIKGAGTHTIVIEGGRILRTGIFKTPPDRLEAGSFAIIAALCGKNLKIANCNPSQMTAVLHILESMGVNVKQEKNSLLIKATGRLRPIEIKTHEYPGFPTDLQAPFSVLLTQASGRSLIFETVFEGRLSYLNDLARMGANVIVCDSHRAIINGPTNLRGREMESPDLRAGLAFLIAGLLAKGTSIVHNVGNIDRGYEKIEERLNSVGADIKRI